MQTQRKNIQQPSTNNPTCSPFQANSTRLRKSSSEVDLHRDTKHLDNALLVLQSHVRTYKRLSPLPFTINRTQLTALFVILKDQGIISKEVTDTELAHFLEAHFLYNNDKRLSGLKIEINKLRNHNKNNNGLEQFFKLFFNNCKIRTVDD